MEAKQRALLNSRLSRDKIVFEKRFAYAQKLRARQLGVEEARSGTPESIAKYSALVAAQESLADKCFTVLCALGLHDDDDDVPDPNCTMLRSDKGKFSKSEKLWGLIFLFSSCESNLGSQFSFMLNKLIVSGSYQCQIMAFWLPSILLH
jgi:hypothetical protein